MKQAYALIFLNLQSQPRHEDVLHFSKSHRGVGLDKPNPGRYKIDVPLCEPRRDNDQQVQDVF